MNPDHWLTAKRLRAHALLLAVATWGICLWTISSPTLRDRNGNLKGTDFLHFYTLGSLAIAHRGGELYDTQSQAVLAAQRVPEAASIRYLPLYPPQVSILFVPFAYLSYGWALALWWLCTTLIYGICCYLIWRTCLGLRDYGGIVGLGALAFPAFVHLIAWGQTAALAMACFTAVFLLLRNQSEFAAGLALGCLIFKPQLGLASALVFIAVGNWKIVAGATVSAGAQIAAGLAYYSIEPFDSWLRILSHVPGLLTSFEPRPYQTHCLRTFWAMLVPWNKLSLGLYVITAIAVLACTVGIWQQTQSLSLKYSALLLATVLVSPHLTVYDLVILAPAILLLADWRVSYPKTSQALGILLYLVYLFPLLGPYARWIHIQVSVIAMLALLYSIWRVAETRAAGVRQAGQPEAAVPI